MHDIVATDGMCRACGIEGILGDGFCQACWDIGKGDYTKLSSREREVLLYISLGMENIEIANRIYIKKKTVEHHVNGLMNKINIPVWANKRVWLALNANRFLGGNGHGSV